MIAPIRQNTLADTVEGRLRQFIRKRGFHPGDALPKETELAAQLDVSRNVVREALSRLRMLGIVESRRRRGMVLAGADIAAVLKRMIHPQLVTDSQDLRELRLVLELGLADLLFLRRQDSLITDLDRIVRREEAAPGDLKLNQQCEIAFHSAIYAATGNTLLACFQDLLQPFFLDARGRHFDPDRFAHPARPNHRQLIAALKRNDVEQYRRLMRQHLSPHFDDLPRERSTAPARPVAGTARSPAAARRARPARATSRRFTLVELLVVIAIIAMLASLPLPALNSSRERAKAVVCATQLSQIGTAAQLYIDDYDGCYWPKLVAGWGTRFSSLGKKGSVTALAADKRPLNAYLGNPGANDDVPICQCPSDTRVYSKRGSSLNANLWPDGVWSGSLTGDWPGVRTRQVRAPSRFVTVGEDGGLTNAHGENPDEASSWLWHWPRPRFNLLFADGHVAAHDVVFGVKANDAYSFHRDN